MEEVFVEWKSKIEVALPQRNAGQMCANVLTFARATIYRGPSKLSQNWKVGDCPGFTLDTDYSAQRAVWTEGLNSFSVQLQVQGSE